MRPNNRRISEVSSIVLLLFVCLFSRTLHGQGFQNALHRATILDGNNISTTSFNYGIFAYPQVSPGIEWPRGSGNEYMYHTGFLVAASVEGNSGERIHFVNDGLSIGGVSHTCWNGFNIGWEPISGYAQPDSGGAMARSDDPVTWPEAWQTWPGLYEDGEILADLESYYVLDDRYNCSHMDDYLPDPLDTERGGAGLQVSVRSFQWNQSPVEDVLFVFYEITNTSSFPMDSVTLGFRGDPSIGGYRDYADDMISILDRHGYDPVLNEERPDLTNMLYAWDFNGRSDASYEGLDPGYFGLHTLNNDLNIQAVKVAPYSNLSLPESEYWRVLTEPLSDDTEFPNNIDNLFIMGLQGFPLAAGESQLVPMAYVMGASKEALIHNAQAADAFYQLHFTDEFVPPTLEIIAPEQDHVTGDNLEIQWSVIPGRDSIDSVAVYLTDSRDMGWQRLVTLPPSATSYTHPVGIMAPGINYQVAVKAFVDGYSWSGKSNHFHIETGAPSPPEFLLLNPILDLEISGSYPLVYRAGQVGGSPAELTLFYSMDNGIIWQSLQNDLALGQQEITFNTTHVPNGEDVRVAFAFGSDPAGEKIYISNKYSIHNQFPAIESEDTEVLSGLSQGDFFVDIVDYTRITGDEYEITFKDSFLMDLSVSVQNLNTGVRVLEDYPVPANHLQSIDFDGMRVSFNNPELEIIDSLSGWLDPNTNFSTSMHHFGGVQRYYLNDYQIIFSDHAVDSSIVPPHQPINGRAFNLTDSRSVGLHRYGTPEVEGRMEDQHTLTIAHDLPSGSSDNWSGQWQVRFFAPDSGELVHPAAGDTLLITTSKPFSHLDTLRFNTSAYTGVKEAGQRPARFSLQQNFPNPFNPSTTIRYVLEVNTQVDLSIYDLSGRLVTSLDAGPRTAGSYALEWNGVGEDGKILSSGIYICRIQIDNPVGPGQLTESMKMIFLK